MGKGKAHGDLYYLETHRDKSCNETVTVAIANNAIVVLHSRNHYN